MLVVAGPTAVGKSAFGLEAARRFGGEIVSADSRQAYRLMDIGTAKPTPAEREAVPHHLVDILDADEDYGLRVFLDTANDVIRNITARGRLPVVVGGSSQYVFALMEGWNPPGVPPNTEFREALERRAETEGGQSLHDELASIDPEAAAQIDPRNVRRVIRALEVRASKPLEPDELRAGANSQSDEALAVFALTSEAKPRGAPMSARAKSPRARRSLAESSLAIGLTLPREALYARIDARVDQMMAGGWIREVEGLVERGYGPELPSMSSIGYQELAEHLAGEADLADAVQRIKHRTHKLARSQYVWLRRAGWLTWFEADEDGLAKAMDRVGEWVALLE